MPVCIAGMHRSGTSVVARMLAASGLYLGPESELMPRNPGEREGHWENKRFVHLNAAILARLRGAWDCPPLAPDTWTGSCLVPFRGEAEALLARFVGQEPWGWKDPRNCLTLPFWQAVVGPMPVVIVVRNPLEVAESLRARNGFSYQLGLMLWQSYNQRLHDDTVPDGRIVTHYDAYSRDPAGELRRLLNFLGLPIDDRVIEQVPAVHVANLRHHRMTTRDLRLADVSPEILDLYGRLCAESGWVEIEGEPADAEMERRLTEAMVRSAEDVDAGAHLDRPGRRAWRPDRFERRQQAVESEARIVALERTVEVQRLALAECEVVKRELDALRRRGASEIEP